MTIILSHESALEYWRAARVGQAPQAKATRQQSLPRRLPRPSEVLTELQEEGLDLGLPVHVLITGENRRSKASTIRKHSTASPAPRDSLVRLGPSTLASSPEMCLLQMAKQLDLPQLVLLGCEFCGSYVRTPQGCMYGLEPATSINKLRFFAERAGGLHGIKLLRRAIPLMLPNSASPMESRLAIMLCFPRHLGGYGLPAPKLNWKIVPDEDERKLVSQDFYVCDLCWPEKKVIAEYDSDQFHTQAGKISHDANRRNDLEALGYHPITVTARHMSSQSQLDDLTNKIAKRLGEKPCPRDSQHLQRQLDLQRSLFAGKDERPDRRISEVLGRPQR